MQQGVSGYFDLPGTAGYGFTGRFFFLEEYDKLSGKRKVSNTGISIQSTIYGGTWWPGGTVAVEGETLGTMTYEGVTTHMVTVNAGEVWYSVDAIADRGGEFPWESSEIESNPDGSKSVTFTVNLTLYRNSSSPKVTISGSHTVTLTDIPMASSISVSASAAAMGDSVTILIDRAANTYTHNLSYSFAGETGVIAEGVQTGAEWEIPLALAKLIPNAVSGQAVITCQTLDGDTVMGTSDATLTLTVPNSDETKPAVSVTVSPVSGLPEKFDGLFIQGQTKVKVTVTAESEYSAVAQIATAFDGATALGAEAEFEPPSESGELAVRVTVTDARGYSATLTATINVLAYAQPKVVPYPGESKVICARCDNSGTPKTDGTSLLILAGRGYSKLISQGEQKNTCVLKYRVAPSGGEYGDWEVLLTVDADSDTINAVVGYGLFDVKDSYTVQIAVVDDVTGKENSILIPVASAGVPLHLGEGGRNLGLGQYCDYTSEDRVDVGWKLWINAGIGALKVFESAEGLAEGRSVSDVFPDAPIRLADSHRVFLAVVDEVPVICMRYGASIMGCGAGASEAMTHYVAEFSYDGNALQLVRARSAGHGDGTTTAVNVTALYALL